MGLIDIGPGATDRVTNYGAGYTAICADNPANDTGIISSFECYANTNILGAKVGTFSGSGTSYTSRDVETIGIIVAGSKQTFSGMNCDVVVGDFIGCYFASGTIEAATSGGGGIYEKTGDQFGAGAQTYSLDTGWVMSLYGSGVTILITTQATTSIEATTATGNGTIVYSPVNCTKRGICWNTTGTPTVADNIVEETGSFAVGAFPESLTGLPSGTTIYARAYGYNAPEYGYGDTVSFLTKPAAPTGLSATDGVLDKVTITWTKSTGATDYHVWRDAVDLGAAGDVATFDDTGGVAGTVYTYKVVASNATGNSADSNTDTGYMLQVPTLTTQAVTAIDIITATGNGNITALGGAAPTIRGVCWSTSANPTTADSKTEESPGPFGTGTYTEPITGLISNTTYHVRPYATNSAGTGYGSDVTFTTLIDPAYVAGRYYKCVIAASGVPDGTSASDRGYRIPTPSVTTQAVSGITATGATGNGTIVSVSLKNCTRRGFCYVAGTSGDPTTADSVAYDDGDFSAAAYTKAITGLSSGTYYRVRAYATNPEGTGYGDTVSLLTKPAAPTSVAATKGTYSDKVTVTWVNSTGATDHHVWRGTQGVHFTGGATSNMVVAANAGQNAKAAFHITVKFKLDTTHQNGAANQRFLFQKAADANNQLQLYLHTDGKLYWYQGNGLGGQEFMLNSTTAIWTAGTWYTVTCSMTDTPTQRLLVNGVLEDSDTIATPVATPNGGNIIMGSESDGATTGIAGTISLVCIGVGATATTALTAAEETGLASGILPPSAKVQHLYRFTEGTGTSVNDLGSLNVDGTLDSACTWTVGDYVDLGSAGLLAALNDTGADAPSIIPGSTVATDGTSAAHVALSLSGNATYDGTTHVYKVIASNASGDSADSATDTGNRAIATPSYQWQRSDAPDSGYSNISGATTATYNDTGAPAHV